MVIKIVEGYTSHKGKKVSLKEGVVSSSLLEGALLRGGDFERKKGGGKRKSAKILCDGESEDILEGIQG